MTPEYLKPSEAADICRVTVDTIYRWVKIGQLEAYRTAGGKTLRIPAKAVSDMLTEHGTAGSL